MRKVCILLTLLAAGLLHAQEQPVEIGSETRIPALITIAQEAYGAGDYERMAAALARAVELRPHLADLRFLLAKAYALQDEKQSAYNALVILQSQGLSFRMTGDPDFENLRGYQLYDYLEEEFAKNAEPYAEPEPRFRLDGENLLVEALAYDPKGGRFLAGSVTEGTVYTVDDDGSLTPFITPNPSNGLLGISALAVDPENNTLWVASGASPHVVHGRPADRGRTYLHQFSLDSGDYVARYAPTVAGPGYFIDLVLAPDGKVYAADSVRPVIWRLEPAAESPQLEAFFGSEALTGIRTLTIDDSGEYLYFADYELGIFGLRIGDNEAFEVHLGRNLNLSGIDLMRWFEDSLILVQNGVVPKRVLRFQLFDDHRNGRHAQAMTSGQPSFRNPTTGTLVGSDLVLIANSHRNAYDPATGRLREGAEVSPHQVVDVALDYGWIPPPEGSLQHLKKN